MLESKYNITESDLIHWKATKQSPFCVGCVKPVWEADHEYYYTVNSPGGYGMDELLICVSCLHQKENRGIYDRLLGLNVLEPQDIIHGRASPNS